MERLFGKLEDPHYTEEPSEREDYEDPADGPSEEASGKEPSDGEVTSSDPPTAVSEEAPLRSIKEIIRDLSKPIAARHIRTRKQGGSQISYIEWHTAVRYLDYYAPGWFFEIRSMEIIGESLVMIVRISIPALEGTCFREASGYELLKHDSYGDPSSNAEAMGLKRAAAKFSLGIGLYEK